MISCQSCTITAEGSLAVQGACWPDIRPGAGLQLECASKHRAAVVAWNCTVPSCACLPQEGQKVPCTFHSECSSSDGMQCYHTVLTLPTQMPQGRGKDLWRLISAHPAPPGHAQGVSPAASLQRQPGRGTPGRVAHLPAIEPCDPAAGRSLAAVSTSSCWQSLPAAQCGSSVAQPAARVPVTAPGSDGCPWQECPLQVYGWGTIALTQAAASFFPTAAP